MKTVKRGARLRSGLLLFAAVGAGLLPLRRAQFKNSKELSWETAESGCLSLQVRYPEAAPEEIEKRVTIPLEEECGRIRGLKDIQSLSEQGMSRIFLEFEGRASDSYIETREAVDRVQPLLPGEASRPEIRTYDIRDAPVFIAAFPPETESSLIEQRLGRVEGSGCVTVSGSAEFEYKLEFEEALASIPRGTLAGAVHKNTVSGFRMGERDAFMDIRPKNASDLGALAAGDESRISDYARISVGKVEPEISARLNGEERIIASVQSSPQESIIPLCRGLAASAEEFAGAEIVYDAGKEAERYLTRIKAALLASVCVMLFASGRPQLCPALVYLASVLLSCSFLSLIRRGAGQSELSAAIIGGLLSAKSLALRVQGGKAFPEGLTTLLCLSAAAVLLALLGNREVGISLCIPSAAALASGLCAGRFLKNEPLIRSDEKGRADVSNSKPRAASLAAAAAALLIVQWACREAGADSKLRENPHVTCTVEFESGTQADETERRLGGFEQWLEKHEDVLRFTSVYEDEQARFDIGLRGRDKGFSAELEARGSDIPGGFLYREGKEEGISVIVSGQDREGLNAAASDLGKELSGLSGVRSVVYHFKEQKPELCINLDPARLSRLGVSAKETAEEIGLSLRSPVIGKMTGDKELDIRLIAPEARLSALGDRRITLQKGGVELENLASFSLKTNFGPVFRIGQSRALSLTVLPAKGLKKRDLSEVRRKIESLLASYEFRDGCRARIKGREEKTDIAGLLLSGLAAAAILLAGSGRGGKAAVIPMLRAAGSLPLPLILSIVFGASIERTAGTILAFFCAADSEAKEREPEDGAGAKADLSLALASLPLLLCGQGLADLSSALASGILGRRLLAELRPSFKAA